MSGAFGAFPFVEPGGCCYGVINAGPGACTCWTPVYETEQEPPRPDLAHNVMPGMCGSCAYRPGSPERTGHEHAGADEDDLRNLAMSGTPFYCHDGLRHPVAYTHPYGVTIPWEGLDFTPARNGVEERPYRADGRPGSLCAGWDAIRRRWAREAARNGVQP